VAQTHFDEWTAARYEALWPELFEPALVRRTVGVLAELAAGGPALEFGAGTGRIALPLSRTGIRVHGIELSEPMARRLRAEPGVEVTVGDFAATTVGEPFALVYLLRNTITNLTTQEEQVRAFGNAAAHLRPGGHFLVENYIPQLRRLPPGQNRHVFAATAEHLGYEEYDTLRQLAVSHHYWTIEGQLRTFSSPHRYVWPSELDLMARLAGLTLLDRWSDWDGTAFTADSAQHISLWRKPEWVVDGQLG
jgi:SAM-dependent methyltransferase